MPVRKNRTRSSGRGVKRAARGGGVGVAVGAGVGVGDGCGVAVGVGVAVGTGVAVGSGSTVDAVVAPAIMPIH